MERTVIFHVDMDAFFASIEQRDTPAYRGKPLIVGAKPGMRGVVSAASYEARKFGVHSAMPISEAVRRCPEGIFVQPRMGVYGAESKAIMAIFAVFSPLVEQVSVDEAFLDMTGTARLLGEPVEAAQKLADRIRTERSITASIGIAPNKFLAKIASDLHKPAGITMAPFDPPAIAAWLAPLPVGRIWGVGKTTGGILEQMGIRTIGDLQGVPRDSLEHRFGKQGDRLYTLCRGIDDRPIEGPEAAKSISREYTFNVDSADPGEWRRMLFSLAQDVARRARRSGVRGATVVLTYRRSDFSRHSRRKPLVPPTNAARFIYEGAVELLDTVREKTLRLIGVGLTSLDAGEQTDLFADEHPGAAAEAAESAMDRIAERFGRAAIAKGREIGRLPAP
jgi:nucleotidyltransferase/DNA polymerase involved in DNA repair